MTIERRSFLKAGIIGAIFYGIPLKFATGVHARVSAAKQPAGVHDIATLSENQPAAFNICTRSNFSQHLHTKFLVYRKTGETEEVTLVKVSGLKTSSRKRSRIMNEEENFSLIFRGSASNPLEQDNYTIKHEELGVFDLFMVAVDRPGSTQNYQVIFNRQRP